MRPVYWQTVHQMHLLSDLSKLSTSQKQGGRTASLAGSTLGSTRAKHSGNHWRESSRTEGIQEPVYAHTWFRHSPETLANSPRLRLDLPWMAPLQEPVRCCLCLSWSEAGYWNTSATIVLFRWCRSPAPRRASRQIRQFPLHGRLELGQQGLRPRGRTDRALYPAQARDGWQQRTLDIPDPWEPDPSSTRWWDRGQKNCL